MPFPFTLSTTSQLSFQPSLTSSTHPSLPSAATSRRAVVRSALKEHKRLAFADQANHLPELVPVLEEYLKYLVSIELALAGRSISGEEVDIALLQEADVEWRPTLSGSSGGASAIIAIPGRRRQLRSRGENGRVKCRDFDFEVYFVHHTLALVHSLLARQYLLSLHNTTTSDEEKRTVLVQNATKRLRTAYSLHAYLVHRSNSSSDGPPPFPPEAPDVSVAVQTGLQYLAHAELNLLGVLKDDPYPAVVMQLRNKDDREWMFKSPSIPKVAAQVRRRLCMGAAEKAEAALANLRGSTAIKVSKDFIDYCEDVRKTAKAKACRFAALDADMGGETGKAIAWLHAGMHELDLDVVDGDGKGRTTTASTSTTAGLKKLKASWKEKREDRKINGDLTGVGGGGVGSSSSSDGGKAEESRILRFLYAKLTKENDTINVQPVPDWRPLLSTMPSGMHITINDAVWRPTSLSEDELIAMRSPPDYAAEDDGVGVVDDSSDDGDDDGAQDKERSGSRARAAALPNPNSNNPQSIYY